MLEAQPHHVDLDQIRREAAAQIEQSAKPEPSPLVSREISIHVKYQSPTGQALQATVIGKAPDREARNAMAVAKARLCFGLPFEAFTPEDQLRIRALASIAILVSDVPSWLKDAMEEDDHLLFSVFEEVSVHADRYFLGDRGEGEGAAKERRVEVRSEPLPR